MEPQKDSLSGRHLIEGRGVPIEGGVFRRLNHPGIVVDSSKLEGLKSFEDSKKIILSMHSDLLNMTAHLSKKYVPVDENFYNKVFLTDFGKKDRFSLSAFVLRDDTDKQTKGTADSQALFAALLLETRVKNDSDRKVWVGKDSTDGHAIVTYEGKSGIYKFDPTKGDTKFEKQTADTV
jgi:hypothetical protein